jgi:hypothetical protein
MSEKGKKDRILTQFTEPHAIIDSGHGKVTYQVWCEKELERINVLHSDAHIVTNEDGMIAISR